MHLIPDVRLVVGDETENRGVVGVLDEDVGRGRGRAAVGGQGVGLAHTLGGPRVDSGGGGDIVHCDSPGAPVEVGAQW